MVRVEVASGDHSPPGMIASVGFLLLLLLLLFLIVMTLNV